MKLKRAFQGYFEHAFSTSELHLWKFFLFLHFVGVFKKKYKKYIAVVLFPLNISVSDGQLERAKC